MAEFYLVEKNDLLEMLESCNRFRALESGGVDNWEGYSWSLGDYLGAWVEEAGLDENYDWDFEDMAQSDLESYTPYET